MIAAFNSGKPSAIVKSIFNLTASSTKIAELQELAGALGALGGVHGFVQALKNGDYAQAVITSGGIARMALTSHMGSLQQQITNRYFDIAAARVAIDEGDEIAAQLVQAYDLADSILSKLGPALSILNIMNSFAKGDAWGVVQGGLSLLSTLPGYAWAGPAALGIAFAQITVDFFSDDDYIAQGTYKREADGSVSILLSEDEGGAVPELHSLMYGLLDMVRQQAATLGGNTKREMGIIVERLPEMRVVGAGGQASALIMFYKDPDTGERFARSFDISHGYIGPGNVQGYGPQYEHLGSTNPADVDPDGEIARGNNFFENLSAQFTQAVRDSGAIAPQWMVETARQQTLRGDPAAGLTGGQRAILGGGSVSAMDPGDASSGSTYQLFKPFVLDLDNNGIIVRRSSLEPAYGGSGGVLVDVDNDGFDEEVDWVGPRDGILLLDRNGDGYRANGDDMFNDPRVSWSYAGDPLKEIDANGDGLINASDPAYAHLRVWLDINSSGAINEDESGQYELFSLQQLGISEIGIGSPTGMYFHGTNIFQPMFFQSEAAYGGGAYGGGAYGGTVKLLGTYLYMNARAAGKLSTDLGNGALVTHETDGTYLMGTAAFDYRDWPDAEERATHAHVSQDGQVLAIDERFDGIEDTTIRIQAEHLLLNDSSPTGVLTFVGVSNPTNGALSYDESKKVIHFTPTANFDGMASFSYTVRNEAGSYVSATAFIELAAVDDNPTVAVDVPRRQADWGDVLVTRDTIYVESSQEVVTYSLPAGSTNDLRDPATQPSNVYVLGTTDTGFIGVLAQRLYYAEAIPGSQNHGLWKEIWVPIESASTLHASDVDTAGPIRISVHRGPRFGTLDFVPGNDTVLFSYAREMFVSDGIQRVGEGQNAENFYGPPDAGPEDAFLVKLTQTIDGKAKDTFERVVLDTTSTGDNLWDARKRAVTRATVAAPPPPLPAPPPSNYVGVPVHGWQLDTQPGVAPKWALSDVLRDQEAQYLEQQKSYLSPLVIDLNGNGFRFDAASESRAFYDIDGSGEKRHLAWTSGADAILAFDANGDGKIVGTDEIAFSQYVAGAQTDLEGLSFFDTNSDGLLSAADAQWNKFLLWRDKNEDGTQQTGELLRMVDVGIASISLSSDGIQRRVDDVVVHGIGSFTRIDGSQGDFADVALAYTDEVYQEDRDDEVTLTVGAGGQGGVLDTGTGDDQIHGSSGDDVVHAGAGADRIDGGAGHDFLAGGGGDDRMLGGDGNDAMLGQEGDDQLVGQAGDDVLVGGRGSDLLDGGEGADRYIFDLGDGHDILVDVGSLNEVTRLELGAGIMPANVRGGHGDKSRWLQLSDADGIEIAGLSLTNGNVEVKFSDGTVWTHAQVIAGTNNAPSLLAPIDDRDFRAGRAFSLAVPDYAFIDLDGDAMTRSVTLADGSALPTWLQYDALTNTLNGTPALGDAGTFAIRVRATDDEGAWSQDVFDLKILANAAPVAAIPLGERTAEKDELFSYTVPAGAFTDADASDVLAYSATLADGSALPAWLTFNAATRTFYGTPTTSDSTTLAIRIKATDEAGAFAFSTLALNVAPASENQAPVVGTALGTRVGELGQPLLWQLGTGAFTDPDAGDTLTWSFVAGNPTALAWLSFDAATRTLSGQAPADDLLLWQEFGGTVTVTDSHGAAASQAITLVLSDDVVRPVNGTETDNLLVGSRGKDRLDGKAGNDTMEGGEGGDVYVVDVAGDVVIEVANASSWGGADTVESGISYVLPDHLENLVLAAGKASAVEGTGNALDNNLVGNEYGNLLSGLGGDDDLSGAAGNDTLAGGTGDDVYRFAAGDGSDVVIEDDATAGNTDTLKFDAIFADQLWLRRQGDDLEISIIGTTDKVTVSDWYLGSQHHIEQIVAGAKVLASSDVDTLVQAMALLTPPPLGQTVLPESHLQALVPLLNQHWQATEAVEDYAIAPTAQSLTDAEASEDAAFTYAVPSGTFSDADGGDELTVSAYLADGSALPSWLSFSAASRSFSGTPDNEEVSTLDMVLLARDSAGNVAYTTLQLDVVNTNDAPTVTEALSNQSATEDAAFSFVVPAGAFADMDVGDTLTLSATLVDGSALPAWLAFDARTRTFSGTPGQEDAGSFGIKVVATDGSGASAFSEMVLTVAASEESPPAMTTYMGIYNDFRQFVYWDWFLESAGVLDEGLLDWSFVPDDPTALGWLTLDAQERTFGGQGPSNDDLLWRQFAGTVVVSDPQGGQLTQRLEFDMVDYRERPVTGDGADNLLTGSRGRDRLNGKAGNDTMQGGDGGDVYLVDAAGDVVIESAEVSEEGGTDEVETSISSYTLPENVEHLTLAWGKPQAREGVGNGLNNYLFGNHYDNVLSGLGGNDILFAGEGNDTLIGGTGDDYYQFSEEDDQDVIVEDDATPGNSDRLEFGDSFERLWLRRQDDDLEVSVIGTEDKVTIHDWYLGAQHHVEQIGSYGRTLVSSDVDVLVQAMALLAPPQAQQTRLSESQLQVLLPLQNLYWKKLSGLVDHATAPTARPLTDVDAFEDAEFAYTVPSGTFTDADEGDEIYVVAYQSDGSALPPWLSFDSASNSFSGTPGNEDLGPVSVVLLARDMTGAGAYAMLHVNVTNTNDAPMEAQALTNQSAIEAAAFSFTVPANTFTDVDAGDTLALSAALASGGTLPSWLSFNAATRTFSGTPQNGDAGSLSLKVTATDTAGAAVSSSFSLVIAAAQQAVQTLNGTSGADHLVGGAGADVLNGLGGHDRLEGHGGDDTLAGGLGSDTLIGGAGDDRFLVQGNDASSDSIDGGDGYDQIVGGAGDDTFVLNQFSKNNSIEKIDGGAGLNRVGGLSSDDLLDFSSTVLVNIAQIGGGWGSDTIIGTAGDDIIEGGFGADVLRGMAGDDRFIFNGNDFSIDAFYGGDGHDQILGGAGDETIIMAGFAAANSIESIDGGAGVNRLAGGSTNDVLDYSGTVLVNIAHIGGGWGDDTITGTSGADVIEGGFGSDVVYGLAGDDRFLVDGNDFSSFEGFFGGDGHDQILGGAGSEIIRMVNFGAANSIEKIDGGGGSANILSGTSAVDVLDFSSTELVNIAQIVGSFGNDTITGSAGNDSITGEMDNDWLRGGLGNDIYQFSRGHGADTIEEDDTTAGNTDVAQFGADIAADQLWFSQSGNDLVVRVIGTGEGLTVKSWYLGDQYHLEQFKSGDGKTLLDSQVQQLVQAMAGFSPPASGQTTLPTNYATTLQPVIAANWQ